MIAPTTLVAMRIHNLYEDERGESHWRDIEVEWTEQTVGGPASARLPASGIIFREMKRKKTLRAAIGQNSRRVVVDLDQVVGEPMSAVDVVDQASEIIVRNCLLIMLEHLPFRLASENAEIADCVRRASEDRQRTKY